MTHLIKQPAIASCSEVRRELTEVHAYLVERARESVSALSATGQSSSMWGLMAKAREVSLDGRRPKLIGKPREKFIEVVNIIATLERMLDALVWAEETFPGAVVRACHPSTSSSGAGRTETDLVIAVGSRLVRIEVCDVQSSKPSQNGKEQQTLDALGAEGKRYLVTSEVWAKGLTSTWRKKTIWKRLPHQALPAQSVVLELL